MALTIATGFVVDDAIVMIENIARYVEGACSRCEAALQRLGADRLHHHLADRLADRGADPAAVHGRRGRPPVPRIRHHPGRHHRHLGRGVADPGADALRAADPPSPRQRARPRSTLARRARLRRDHRRLRPRSRRGARPSALTLLVALGTLALTVAALYRHPQGLLPARRTPGVIQGITEAPQIVSFEAMAGCQQKLAEVLLKDQDVVSLTSFIGVDGTNMTLNSGRFLINLKPHGQRTENIAEIIRRLEQETASVAGIDALHAAGAGPDHRRQRQPRAISVRAGKRRTRRCSPTWAPKLIAKPAAVARTCRCRQRHAAAGRWRSTSIIDRDDGRALRHHAGDDRQRALRRLRPAHHLDHLHPVEPVPRHPGGGPDRCRDRSPVAAIRSICRHSSTGQRPGAALGHRPCRPSATAPLVVDASRPVPGDHHLLQPGAGVSLGAAVTRHRQGRRPNSACRRASSPASRARRRPSSPR